MDTKRKRTRYGAIFILIAGILLAGYSFLAARSEPDVLEYMFSAGKVSTTKDDAGVEAYSSDLDGQLKSFAKMPMYLEGAATAVTITGNAQKMEFTNEYKKMVESPLVALGENAFDVLPRFLLSGRVFYPDELLKGAYTMLVDEEFALALFQMTNVVGREVILSDATYRIVGVLRHSRRVGEAGEFFAYIPLKMAHLNGIQLDTITLSAVPIQNAGAMATFDRAAKELSKTGTFYNAVREKTGATLMARLVLCGFLFAVLRRLLMCLVRSVGRLKEVSTRRLEETYMVRVLPGVVVGILWRILAFAAIAGAAAYTFVFLVQPVYVFTDYIPAVLVEPEEIIKTFWGVQSQKAAGLVYRTVTAARMDFFAGLSWWGSVMVLYGLLQTRRLEGVKEP